MLELASTGAKVLQTRAVLLAKNTGVKIHVKPFANPDAPGTVVISEDELMEQSVVSAVAIDKNEAKIGITRLPDAPGVAGEIFSALTEKNIFVDMIVQNMSHEGQTALAFTVPKDEAEMAFEIVSQLGRLRKWGEVVKDKKVAKVSAIGAGMRTSSGVASKMFQALAKEGINIIMIGTSEIRISCLIEEKYAELALQTLHEAFGLGKSAPTV
jgi:aspartate kinase